MARAKYEEAVAAKNAKIQAALSELGRAWRSLAECGLVGSPDTTRPMESLAFLGRVLQFGSAPAGVINNASSALLGFGTEPVIKDDSQTQCEKTMADVVEAEKLSLADFLPQEEPAEAIREA